MKFSCDAEREYFEEHGAAKHAFTANLIDALQNASSLLPSDLCNCDVGRCCRPHAAIDAIAMRNVRAGRDWRPRVERFVRLIGRGK